MKDTNDGKGVKAMNAEIIKTFTNEADGMSAIVNKMSKGFSVVVRDNDSGEYLDTIRIYPNVEDALKKAQEIL